VDAVSTPTFVVELVHIHAHIVAVDDWHHRPRTRWPMVPVFHCRHVFIYVNQFHTKACTAAQIGKDCLGLFAEVKSPKQAAELCKEAFQHLMKYIACSLDQRTLLKGNARKNHANEYVSGKIGKTTATSRQDFHQGQTQLQGALANLRLSRPKPDGVLTKPRTLVGGSSMRGRPNQRTGPLMPTEVPSSWQ
jgi:hypothetical protein